MTLHYFSADGTREYGPMYKDLADVSIDMPDPVQKDGYSVYATYNPDTGTADWVYAKNAKPVEEQVKELQDSVKTADEKYAELDLTTASLDDIKAAKIAQLKELCSNAIYDGFDSSIGHSFGFNELDQANFTQQSVLIVLNGLTDTDTVQWKTKDAGVVDLTIAQFKTIIGEAKDYKLQQQTKYWGLEAQVNAATTNAEVDAVVW